jgi:hypothetical protein
VSGTHVTDSTSSAAAARAGLVTPGGSDLAAVVSRNADKLRLLSDIPEAGSTEALDSFLATFVARSSQVCARAGRRVSLMFCMCMCVSVQGLSHGLKHGSYG